MILRKEDFVNYTGQEFLDNANFQGYWFNQIENDTIELFAVIGEPKDEWAYVFHHYFDLKTKKFNIKERTDKDI